MLGDAFDNSTGLQGSQSQADQASKTTRNHVGTCAVRRRGSAGTRGLPTREGDLKHGHTNWLNEAVASMRVGQGQETFGGPKPERDGARMSQEQLEGKPESLSYQS